MKHFTLVFFDWDKEVVYDTMHHSCETYADMMIAAEKRCDELMRELDIDNICWNYTEIIHGSDKK